MEKIFYFIRKPIAITLVLVVICGLIYPLVLMGVSKVVFPEQANGSLVRINDSVVGSKLIGQSFSGEGFLHSRPSAVNYNTYTVQEKKDYKYNGVASGSSNYAMTNPDLTKRTNKDIKTFLRENSTIKKNEIPTDLVTSSGSGLDPHISPQAAAIQIPSVSKKTGISEKKLKKIVRDSTEEKFIGIFGERTVNVLEVNVDIVKAKKLGKFGSK
uniref:K(+)-transporting ATPase subunit C n=1 Tax=Listeria grayi TaxID=1641 RepID=UPI001D122006|nr:K(+)-transporting ATPase subunit C [Listeria grayi]UCK61974.1 potassium-transporting ATPase subunit C [Listeria grayi]